MYIYEFETICDRDRKKGRLSLYKFQYIFCRTCLNIITLNESILSLKIAQFGAPFHVKKSSFIA